jgi:cytochrome P450
MQKKTAGPKIPLLAYAALYRDPLTYLTRAARKYGDAMRIEISRRQDFLLNHPDYIRAILLDQEGMRRSVHRPVQRLLGQGLLTSRGSTHRKQRTLLQPIFQKHRIAALGDVMVQQTARWSDKWRGGQTVDMQEEMHHLSMAITGKTLFDVDVESEAAEVGEALLTVMSATRFNNLLLVSKNLEKLPLPANQRFRRAAKRLDEFIYEMIAQRHAHRSEQPDLLSVLVRLSETKPRMMNDKKIRDQILTFFVAGHETVATALTWTWYLLARNPDVTRKLYAEIDKLLRGRLPCVADVERLPYTKMVLAESMRLYPPVWIIGRHAIRDTQINGIMIPKGSYVHVSQFLMHRDARYFPDPERFDPERWQPEAVAARPRFSYFPFGGGGLQCIGEGFAWTQGVLVIAALTRRWKMQLAPGVRIKLEPQLTLRSRYGMPMKLRQRAAQDSSLCGMNMTRHLHAPPALMNSVIGS